MKTRIVPVLVVCAVSLFLSACSPGPKATITVTCDDFAQVQNIVAQAEKPFPVGKSFSVGLCSDPSTSFQWQESATINDQNVVQQTGHKLVSGWAIWTFEALSEGRTLLTMECTRSLQGVEGMQRSFQLAVFVE